MAKYASEVVKLAQSWVGLKESDGSYKVILDIYNSQAKLPRGYKMTTKDPWCAATMSALAVKLGYTDIMPTECSCSRMIELYKKLGCWVEDESVTPLPGWLALYDWQDTSGKADNKNSPDHIGVVEKVSNGVITIIEGNYSNSVKRREVPVNGKYLRGYCVPKYDAEPKKEEKPATNNTTTKGGFTLEMRYLKKGCRGEDVRALQFLLRDRGYNDKMGTPDGIFGPRTKEATKKYQRAKGLEIDGIAGPATMSSLLGLEVK